MAERGTGGTTGRLRSALLATVAGLAASACLVSGPAAARDVSVRGSMADRFARIELTFDQATKVQARVANGVLVLSFGAPAKVKAEKLVSELPTLVSAVRRDPDDSGLRLALAGPVRANVLEAGETVLVDLLPQNWAGQPPPLPPALVARLAERARIAEAKLKERRAADAKGPVRLRLAVLPTLTRLVFETPPGTASRTEAGQNGGVEIAFDGADGLDEGGEKPKVAPGIGLYAAEASATGMAVRLAAAPGFQLRSFVEGDTVVVDFARPGASKSAAALPEAAAPAVSPVPLQTAAEARKAAAASEPSRAAPARAAPAAAVPPPASPRPASTASGPLLPRAELVDGRTTLLFPFRSATAAAAFERAGRLTLVFDTRDTLDAAAVAAASRDVLPFAGLEAQDGFAVLRFAAAKPGAEAGGARLVADGDGWRLVPGGQGLLPPDPVRLGRGTDPSGRALIVADLAGAAAAHWLREPDGTRLAVVTATGRPQALAIPRSFVEFDMPASLQGLLIEARADDLTVGLGTGQATIGREGGLSLSSPPVARGGEAGAADGLVLSRASAPALEVGEIRERHRALLGEVAAATRAERAEPRLRLARFLVANGMAPEAVGVLALARSEDPVFARRRETRLLSGIAAARAGHAAEARAFLGSDGLADDGEAVFWRAVLDAQAGRHAAALVGFRRSAEILDLYPDALAGSARLLALRAALSTGDVARAEGELAAIAGLPAGSVPRLDLDFARAELDEAAGRGEAAARTFAAIAADGSGRPAAAAALRLLRADAAGGRIGPEEAIRRLEVLAVAWRGDAVELGTVVDLADRYGEARRWRDMLAVARYAERYFPDEDDTRALHDRTTGRFEALMLGTGSGALPAIDALALYFDFRDFAPVGRRGDEIVRRLADRLVELDLLDQAAELLQHQVDRRLSGVARAAVAARLAAIRLLSGKPMMAVATLAATRFADLPGDLRRVRTLLEARGQADLTRTDLALEILDGETGPEAGRLRAAILWDARRWREAGEASEALLAEAWQSPAPLSDLARKNVLRAAVAYQLAQESIGLDRLRARVAGKMADSPDAATFATLLRPDAVSDRTFRGLLKEFEGRETLRDLLAGWKHEVPSEGAAESDPARRAADRGSPGGRNG